MIVIVSNAKEIEIPIDVNESRFQATQNSFEMNVISQDKRLQFRTDFEMRLLYLYFFAFETVFFLFRVSYFEIYRKKMCAKEVKRRTKWAYDLNENHFSELNMLNKCLFKVN